MMHDETGGFFAFKRSFHLESKASLEQVVHSLKRLGDADSSSSLSHEIFIERQGKDYTFQYRIQRYLFRRRGRVSPSITAFSAGRVQEAESGPIFVEGYTQIEPWTAYFFVGFYTLLACASLSLVQGIYILIPLFFAGMAAYKFFRYYSDYKQARDGVAKAVSNTHNMRDNLRSDTVTQTSYTEKAKAMHTPVGETDSYHGVWKETLSEYDAQVYNSKH